MTQTPAANASWFNFTAQSGDFGVYAFSGFEEACKPYEFSMSWSAARPTWTIARTISPVPFPFPQSRGRRAFSRFE